MIDIKQQPEQQPKQQPNTTAPEPDPTIQPQQTDEQPSEPYECIDLSESIVVLSDSQLSLQSNPIGDSEQLTRQAQIELIQTKQQEINELIRQLTAQQ
jgi:hypothetical protein